MTTQRILLTGGLRIGKTTAYAAAVQRATGLRACAICMHSAGQQTGPVLLCRSPEVTAVHGDACPCSKARSAGGACGHGARHMDMAAWHQTPTSEAIS